MAPNSSQWAAWKELMPTDVIMPQMGESIFEGTITKWLKKPGDKVQRDEPLFEISTDKVDAEIPAPASGVLQEIMVGEGNTVQVNTVVGTISADGESAALGQSRHSHRFGSGSPTEKRVRFRRLNRRLPAPCQPSPRDDDEDVRSSPLVRKIAREHNVDLAASNGHRPGGRITKQDIMAFIEKGPAAAPAPPAAPSQPAPPASRPATNSRSRGHPGRSGSPVARCARSSRSA